MMTSSMVMTDGDWVCRVYLAAPRGGSADADADAEAPTVAAREPTPADATAREEEDVCGTVSCNDMCAIGAEGNRQNE